MQQQQQQQQDRRHDRPEPNHDRLYDPRNPTKPLMSSPARASLSSDSPVGSGGSGVGGGNGYPPHPGSGGQGPAASGTGAVADPQMNPTSAYYGGGRVPPPHPGFVPPSMGGGGSMPGNFYNRPYGHPPHQPYPGYFNPDYSGDGYPPPPPPPSGDHAAMAAAMAAHHQHMQYMHARGMLNIPPGSMHARDRGAGGFIGGGPDGSGGGAIYREPSKMQHFEGLLREATAVDNQLSNLLSRWPLQNDHVPKVIELRERLCSLLVDLLFFDLELANKHNLEQMLWKSCFYQVIELSRKSLSKALDENDKEGEAKVRDWRK